MLGILVAFMIFVAGYLIIEPLKDNITTSRSDLNCSTPALITDGNKMMCLIIDGTVPYFIITMIALSLGFVTRYLT